MISSYLNRPYSPATIDPEPSRLLLDFLFANHAMLGVLGLDIETKAHSLLTQRKEGMVWHNPEDEAKADAEAAVRTDCMEIGVIQFMDSAGQFGYITGDTEVEVLLNFWRFVGTFPENTALPIFVSHNGAAFDIHNIDARTAILGSFQGLADLVPKPFMKDSKYGDRNALPQLDVGMCYSAAAGRGMPKLHYLAQNIFLPGKPTQSGQDAVEMLYSGTEEQKRQAIEYMTYDVRTPIQIAYLGDLLRRQFLLGLGGNRQAAALQLPYILPKDQVKGTAKPFAEQLPAHHVELLTLAPKFPTKRAQLERANADQVFPNASREVIDLINGMANKRRASALCTPEFQSFCQIARRQAGLPETEAPLPIKETVTIGYSKQTLTPPPRVPGVFVLSPEQSPKLHSDDHVF